MAKMKKGVQYSVTRPEEGKKVLYNGRPTNGITKAMLHETAYDVIDMIERHSPFAVMDPERYMLANGYSATTSCLATEEYDEAKGMDMAKRKMLTRMNKDIIAKIDLMIEDLEAAIKYLKRQKKIRVDRIERDEKYMDKERAGKK